ncbi:hypothetical protein VPH35_080843 [Triticum aestivum]
MRRKESGLMARWHVQKSLNMANTWKVEYHGLRNMHGLIFVLIGAKKTPCGIPHGRLAIANGAIKKADVISTSREKKLRLSTSASLRRTIQEKEELKRRAIRKRRTEAT